MGIIEQARDIATLVKKYNDQELYEKIVELREEIIRLREENIDLYGRIKELEDAARTQSDLVRDGNCYYKIDDESRDHPYCLTCWDYDHKLVGLILGHDYYSGGHTFRCNVCAGRKQD